MKFTLSILALLLIIGTVFGTALDDYVWEEGLE